MTTEATTETGAATEQPGRPRSRGDIALSFAGQIAQMAQHSRGDLAGLRRMDPNEPDAAAYWRLMAREEQLGNGELERKWGLILHGIALMTPTNSGEGNTRTVPVGEALFLGNEAQRGQALYSEARFNRLLTARGPMLRILLARLFRMLAAAGVSFNWHEMARYILAEGYDDDQAEEIRRNIARAYYRAEWRSGQQSHE